MMSSSNYTLTIYPLSQEFQERLETSLNSTVNYLTINELRRLSWRELIITLRTLKADHFFLALEDENSKVFLPILKIIAAISDAKRIEIIDFDSKRHRIFRVEVFCSLYQFIVQSLSIQVNAEVCKKELQQLEKKQLLSIHLNTSYNSSNILYINGNLWFGVQAGGSVGHIAGIINGFFEKEYKIDFITPNKNSLINSKVNYYLLNQPLTFGIPAELNYYHFQKIVNNQVYKVTKLKQYQFIYQRMSLANYTGVLASRKLKIPLVLEYNGSEVWIAQNWGRPLRYHKLAKKVEEICLKHAHIIVTISEVLKEELIQKGVESKRIVCYPNCIDPKIFNPDRFSHQHCKSLRQKYNIPNDAVLAMFVGTFGEWHGVDILAQVIKSLVDKELKWVQENKLHFMLVGDGLKMPNVKSILSQNHYQKFFTLTGLIEQSKTPLYLATSNILLSPHVENPDKSRFFGSPTKLFEYMAMGKGIVASDLEQIGQILKNSFQTNALPKTLPIGNESQLSILVRPGDIEGLVKGIKFLTEQPNWRKTLGCNARKEALKKYTWHHHVDEILKKINNLNSINETNPPIPHHRPN
jgi:glycosyltransferase involved in cell wall biosynthesis